MLLSPQNKISHICYRNHTKKECDFFNKYTCQCQHPKGRLDPSSLTSYLNKLKFFKIFSNSSMNRGRRLFLTRLPGGRRLFVTYWWGKPQLDEVENAEGASVPRR